MFQADEAQFEGLTSNVDEIVFRTFDSRIKHVSIPEDARSTDDAGYQVIDWVIENLNQLDPSCESARYLLITSGGNTYGPSSFDSVSEDQGSLVGLNVESRRTIWNNSQLQEARSWEDYCARLEKVSLETQLAGKQGIC